MRKLTEKIAPCLRRAAVVTARTLGRIRAHETAEYILLSIIMYFTVDILCRRSFTAPFKFMLTSPVMFVFNFLIVLFTMSLSLFFRHKYFVYLLNAVFWLTVSITDFVLLGMRNDPFAAIDLKVIVTALGVVPKYIGWGGIFAIIAAFAAAIALLVILWRHHPENPWLSRTRAAVRSAFIAFVLLVLIFATSVSGFVPAEFEGARVAYDDYGFPYCFFRSFILQGVSEPDEYSAETVGDLLDRLDGTGHGKRADALPSVIFLQLESFFDVNKVQNLTLSENPIPNFTALKNTCPTGKFSVNTIGGGTANTEFEVLCGMNLSHFGLLEVPYTTILFETPCESAASVMSNAGFTAHAIHNHKATFYSRNLVYPNLGFDTFTPVEYMTGVEENMLGWAKDKILTDQIINTLDSTAGHDFIFTVSVQPHGRYPDYETASEDDIQVTSYTDEKKIFEIEYYVNQLHETDAFLGDLLRTLSDYPEDVVLVVYGDHLPTLGLEAENMFDGDLYSTEYAVWSNFDFACDGGDIQAFQLSAMIMEALHMNIEDGYMFLIHEELSDADDYDAAMKLMEYDMLKGERIATGGGRPDPTDMRFGTVEITLSGVKMYDDVMFVYGENFTRDSYVFINGRRYDTVFVSDTQLLAKDVKARTGDSLYVAQLCDKSTMLSHTEPVTLDFEKYDETDVVTDILTDVTEPVADDADTGEVSDTEAIPVTETSEESE